MLEEAKHIALILNNELLRQLEKKVANAMHNARGNIIWESIGRSKQSKSLGNVKC